MSHCHDEHSHGDDHDHDHNHNHVHDHSEDITPAIQNLLYEQIDFPSVRVLNEKTPNSGRSILQKTWAQRFHPEPELESDADEQLILHIPFTGQVRLHSFHIRTSTSPTAPKTLHLHLNNEDLDFTTVTSSSSPKPTQTFALGQTSEVQDVPVKRTLFANTRHLTLFVEDNFGNGEEDVTQISYLAFKGDFMRLNREPVEVLYEAAARPSDHKVPGQKVGAGMGGMGLDGPGGGGRQGF